MRSKYAVVLASGLLLSFGIPQARAQAPRSIFVTPIANAPFTAVVNVQRTRIQSDGTVLNLKSIRVISRNGQGVIYNEARPLLPATSSATPPVTSIHVYDPQTRANTFLDPQNKTAWRGTVEHPPSTVPPGLYATPSSTSLPASQFSKEEDLGTKMMEGVIAHGVRETQTIPAAQSSSGKEITVTDEYWYSDDLRLNLVVKHDDPAPEA